MRVPVADLIIRTIIARRYAYRYSQQCRLLECLVNLIDGLLCPGSMVFGISPADGEHRGFVLIIVNGGIENIHPALLGEGTEVNRNCGPRADPRDDFDIQHYFPFRSIMLVGSRMINA